MSQGKTALITGITGQDGGYLAELLLGRGYMVHGMVRATTDVERSRLFSVLQRSPDYAARVSLHVAELTDVSSLDVMLDDSAPDEVYHLAGQSYVQHSFELPEYTAETTGLGTLRLLELTRRRTPVPAFYQASTSEMFGESSVPIQSESTPVAPVSPYAAAKLYAYSLVRAYRRAYGLHASNGILFNHESPWRGGDYVTQKIARAAAEIAAGTRKELVLGNLDARRDWGFAGDYVEAMYLMVQAAESGDYVVATGESHSVRELCELAFGHVGLDYRPYVRQDPRFFRPTDITETKGDATKAREELGWTPKVGFRELVVMMVDSQVERLARENEHPGAPLRAGARS